MDITSLALAKGYTNKKTNGMLRNTGYFNSKDELPQIAQPSGEKGVHPSVFEIDPTKAAIEIQKLPNLTTANNINTPYVFGFYIDSENYFFVSTDNPELIDGFSYSLDGNFNIYTNQGISPEDSFSVYHACYNGMVDTAFPFGDPDGHALFIPDLGTAIADFNAGVNYAAMCIGPPTVMGDFSKGIAMTYLGGKGPFRIFGNLPTVVKYRPHLRYALKTVDGLGMVPTSWEYLPEDATRDSLTLAFANNYTYTDGMDALRFDENYNAYWITDAEGAKTNDTAVVGENQLYVVNNNNEWKNLGGGSSDPIPEVETIEEKGILNIDIRNLNNIAPDNELYTKIYDFTYNNTNTAKILLAKHSDYSNDVVMEYIPHNSIYKGIYYNGSGLWFVELRVNDLGHNFTVSRSWSKMLTVDGNELYNVSNRSTPAHKKYVDDAIAAIDIPEVKTIEEQGLSFIDLESLNLLGTSSSCTITKNSDMWNKLQELTFGTGLEYIAIITQISHARYGIFYGRYQGTSPNDMYQFNCDYIFEQQGADSSLNNYKYYFYMNRGINYGGTTDSDISIKRETIGLLTMGNTKSYIVSSNYNPAHKKYVDDAIATAINNITNGDEVAY